MKHRNISLVVGLVAGLLISTQAMSAAYVKYDGVDGESKDEKPKPTTTIEKKQTAKPAALLLPAVQSARESVRPVPKPKPKTKGGNAETTWKVEKGEK